MAFASENIVCKYLYDVLKIYEDGESIGDVEELSYVLSILEVTIPEILSQKHSFWKDESLDGFFGERVIKLSENEIEFFGMCTLMSEQALTPIYFRIELGEGAFASAQVKLGEKEGDEMVKIPADSDDWGDYLDERTPKEIEWVYEIEM